MRLYLLHSTGIVWFILSISYCHAQEYHFRSEPKCGNHLKDVNTINRDVRREAEALIKSWDTDSIDSKRGAGTIIKNEAVRIDLQGLFNRDEKRWANLQVQINGPRKKGQPSTIATVMLETGKTFPVLNIKQAFGRSMQECAFIWLSQILTTTTPRGRTTTTRRGRTTTTRRGRTTTTPRGRTTTTRRGRTTTTPRGRTTTTKRGLMTLNPTTKKNKKLN